MNFGYYLAGIKDTNYRHQLYPQKRKNPGDRGASKE